MIIRDVLIRVLIQGNRGMFMGVFLKNDSTPLYLQVKNKVKKDIRTGILKPGDKLPSETQMQKEYSHDRGLSGRSESRRKAPGHDALRRALRSAQAFPCPISSPPDYGDCTIASASSGDRKASPPNPQNQRYSSQRHIPGGFPKYDVRYCV